MRVKALALRIMNQIRHDKRTLGLVLIAPLLILTVIYFIFDSSDSDFTIGVVDAPQGVITRIMDTEDVTITILKIDADQAEKTVNDEKAIAVLDMSSDSPKIYLDASDPSSAGKVVAILKSAVMLNNVDGIKDSLANLKNSIPPALVGMITLPELPNVDPATADWKTVYVYGSADSSFFDSFGAPMFTLGVPLMMT